MCVGTTCRMFTYSMLRKVENVEMENVHLFSQDRYMYSIRYCDTVSVNSEHNTNEHLHTLVLQSHKHRDVYN